jgi:hypothetical protein
MRKGGFIEDIEGGGRARRLSSLTIHQQERSGRHGTRGSTGNGKDAL